MLAQKKAAFDDYNLKKLDAGRAKAHVDSFEGLATRAPKLHKILLKHEDIVKDLNSLGRFTPEMANILRKRGESLEGLDDEIEIAYTPEEIDEAGKPDPVVTPEGEEPVTPEVVDEEEIVDEEVVDENDPVVPPKTEKKEPEKSERNTVADILGTVAQYSPAIYNIIKGLEAPDKVERRFVNPRTMDYENMSQAQLNAVQGAFNAAQSGARNLSGGLTSNYRSNVEKAWADKISRTAEVNTQEAARFDAIEKANTQILNQADQINTQTHQKADIMDMQAEAATNSFLGQGMQDVANISAMHRKDKNAEKADLLALEYIKGNRPWNQ
jgi:hypothetical protein